jgi:hypothetical protein
LRLRDPVVHTPDIINRRLRLRANLLGRDVEAHTGRLHTQPDPVLLRQRLCDAGIKDDSHLQRTFERGCSPGNRTGTRITAKDALLEGDAQLRQRLRGERLHGENRETMGPRRTDILRSFLSLEFRAPNASVVRSRGFERLRQREELCVG